MHFRAVGVGAATVRAWATDPGARRRCATLRGSDSCTAPTPATVKRLELSGAGAGPLRAGDFAGLSGLRALLLDGTLPDGLFVGLLGLRERSHR